MPKKKSSPDQLLERAVRSSGSIAEVGRKLGVSRQAVHQWRTGTRPIPTDHLEKIASIAGR